MSAEVKLTEAQKLLIRGLRLFDLSEEEQEATFICLQTEGQQIAMMDYLATHRNATGQDILKELSRILKVTKTNNYKEEDI